ncbi:ThiF family adenylyltransferase [Phenylobacterium sp.]|uniref:ThiF family adenylyltransferase n=1 Tax=Phenylobacterium sp. TaxID=1871053 RepID=UPI003BAAEDF3
MIETVAARVARALELDGFRPQVSPQGLSFRGALQVRAQRIVVRLDYDGTEFAHPPAIFIENPDALGMGVFPHLDEDGKLCAVDQRQFVADRYRAAELARGIVRRAALVLEKGQLPSAVAEIAEEFPRHWGGHTISVEFGPFDGFAEPFADQNDKMRLRRSGEPILPPKTGAVVVATSTPLSFRAGQRRPQTLAEVLAWADTWDSSLRVRLVERLAAVGPTDPYAVIHAPNGIVGFQLLVSSRGTNQVAAITRPSTWAKLLQARFGLALPIKRLQGIRVDTPYILGTNSHDGSAPLSGKRVVLVGCGAIGGFLSVALAQLGAGLSTGVLTLIDPEKLADRNVARHRNGIDRAGLAKAIGCKQAIDLALPGLSVVALERSVERCRHQVNSADLVIDATGEQGISEMLNAWRLAERAEGKAGPDLLHTWVEGNGAAVQSFLGSDPEFGCYRCLHPDHLKEPRFPVLRPDADITLATGCGETPFSPYGPAAPMAASALAAHHATDWARGHGRPLLRTIRLSYAETQERKPTNPPRSALCPACSEDA